MTNDRIGLKVAESKTDRLRSIINNTEFSEVRGRVTQVIGTLVRATVSGIRIGDVCWLVNPDTQKSVQAEVVGFSKQEALLTPLGDMEGLSAETEVVKHGRPHDIIVGDQLLGRVLDGMGSPIDTGPALVEAERAPTSGGAPNPLARTVIDTPIFTGIKAIDSLLTCGMGQRLGVFAAAGVGKSSLLSMITRCTDADVIVIGLIGERGREVRSFIERDLGPDGMKRAVVIVATSDRPPMERVKAAYVATSIAEHFRDQGKNVLLLMDSITRFARALREIGLAAGEPPARRGFPPSVFATLPKLLERAGPAPNGSITAFYTVLVEGDDMSEPVADEVRSILDGHIVLSRSLAESGHFPAIDVLASNSRLMNDVTSREHQEIARSLRQLMSKYQDIELLVQVGEYQSGQDPLADAAIEAHDLIRQFLSQNHFDAPSSPEQCLAELEQIHRAVAP